MKILLFFLLSNLAFPKTYNCEFNLAPPGKTLNAEESKEFVREIQFDTNQKEGKVLNFKNQNIFIWAKNNLINIRYEDKSNNFEFTTNYIPTRDSFSFNVAPNKEFKCFVKKDESSQESVELSLQKENLTLVINSDLKFIFYQSKANDRMRAIIFQEGDLYSLDSEREKDKDWCIFNIQVKLDEDTYISKNTKIKVVGFNLLSNNDQQNVYAYDFVDIAQGKKVTETSRYVPFSLECKIGKGNVLSPEYFKKITGNRLSFIIGN